MIFYFLFILYVILTTSGLFLIKLGGGNTYIAIVNRVLSINFNLIFVLGLICYICSFFLFTYILQKQNLSIIYPVSAGIVNVIAVLLGVFFLKEKFTGLGFAGIFLIILGVIFLNIQH